MSNSMREILFRGKRLIDGKWAESCCSLGEMRAGTVTYDFDQKTVGQYTGLTDKNGTKIFEGDIVDYNGTKHEVVFETRASAYFGIKISHIETWQFCLEVPAKLMEVVGNIHDNPKLLKKNNE